MKVTIADEVRLGSDVAAVKRRLSRKKWRNIVRVAHKQGFTVAGALSDTPKALKERTRKSLLREAQRTVNRAYKPQEREVTRQQARLDAIAAKRQQDADYYREWLMGETAKLQAQARTADATLLDRQREIAQTAADGYKAAQAQAQANAAATPGNVSDPKQSTALNQDFDAAAKHSADLIGNQRQQTADLVGNTEKTNQFVNAAILANAAAQRAKIEGESRMSQEKLDELSAKLASSKSADYASTLQGLFANETNKANANRDYAAAAQKLGLEKSKLKLDFLKEKHDYGIKKKQLDLEQYKADNAKAYNRAKIKVDYDKIRAAKGKAAADRALRKWIVTHKPEKKKPATATERKDYTRLENIRSTLDDFWTRFPTGKTANGRDYRAYLADKGVDDVFIDIAEDLRRHGGLLSAAGFKKAKKLGLAQFYGRFKASGP